MCLTPLARHNWSNSSLRKRLLLSDTIVFGSPKIANVFLSFVRVALVIAADITSPSMYLLWALTMMSIMRPSNRPAWPMCLLCHVRPGHSQGCNGATGAPNFTTELSDRTFRLNFPTKLSHRTFRTNFPTKLSHRVFRLNFPTEHFPPNFPTAFMVVRMMPFRNYIP